MYEAIGVSKNAYVALWMLIVAFTIFYVKQHRQDFVSTPLLTPPNNT